MRKKEHNTFPIFISRHKTSGIAFLSCHDFAPLFIGQSHTFAIDWNEVHGCKFTKYRYVYPTLILMQMTVLVQAYVYFISVG